MTPISPSLGNNIISIASRDINDANIQRNKKDRKKCNTPAKGRAPATFRRRTNKKERFYLGFGPSVGGKDLLMLV
jgi:hypothetical protein